MDRAAVALRAVTACAVTVVALAAFRRDADQRAHIRDLEQRSARALASEPRPSLDPRDLEAIAERAATLAAARVAREAPAPARAEPDRAAVEARSPSREEQLAARRAAADAARALDDARARGRLQRSDVEAMREALSGASPEVVEEARNAVAAAINRGELAIADRHFVLP